MRKISICIRQPVVTSMEQILSVMPEDTKDFPNRVKVDFNPKLLEDLLSRSDLKELRFFVVTVGGPKRIGKSFLVNLFANFLEFLEKNGPCKAAEGKWLETNRIITCVNSGQSEDPITHGIDMWKRPFVINSQMGEKVVVLLMDCEGLYDTEEVQKTIDGVITVNALELSSVFMMNTEKDLQLPDLEHIEEAILAAKTAEEEVNNMKRIFNALMMVFRNYNSSTRYGIREKPFRLSRSPSKETLFLATFTDYKEVAIPYPGGVISCAPIGAELPMEDLMKDPNSKKFLEVVHELCQHLFLTMAFNEDYSKTMEEMTEAVDLLKEYNKSGYADSAKGAIEKRRIQEVQFELENDLYPEIEAAFDAQSFESEEAMMSAISLLKKGALAHVGESKGEFPGTTDMAKAAWRDVKQSVEEHFQLFAAAEIASFQTRNSTYENVKKGVIVTAGLGLTVVGVAGGFVLTGAALEGLGLLGASTAVKAAAAKIFTSSNVAAYVFTGAGNEVHKLIGRIRTLKKKKRNHTDSGAASHFKTE